LPSVRAVYVPIAEIGAEMAMLSALSQERERQLLGGRPPSCIQRSHYVEYGVNEGYRTGSVRTLEARFYDTYSFCQRCYTQAGVSIQHPCPEAGRMFTRRVFNPVAGSEIISKAVDKVMQFNPASKRRPVTGKEHWKNGAMSAEIAGPGCEGLHSEAYVGQEPFENKIR
jgi:hypothetical protein